MMFVSSRRYKKDVNHYRELFEQELSRARFFKALYLEMYREVVKANKGIARLRRRLEVIKAKGESR